MRRLGMLMLVAGCGGGSGATKVLSGLPDAPLSTAAEAKTWASASAPNMYLQGAAPMLLPPFTTDGGDPNCPKRTKSGTTTTVTGGCTDSSGRKWRGEFIETREGPDGGSGTVSYRQFGYEGEATCMGGMTAQGSFIYDGTFTVTGSSKRSFTVDVVNTSDVQGCGLRSIQYAVSYSGTVEDSVWNGSGSYGIDSVGKVSAETKDERIGGPCANEAASGTTTLRSGARTAVITYDGASKCDTDARVKWSLDGVDQGELTGVSCSATSQGAGLLLLVGVAWLRRRRHGGRAGP